MNLEKGIKLEITNVFINWGITIQQLSEQLKIEVKNSQNNIYLKNENCLNGLKCNISFHFNEKNELYWISLKRTDYEELSLSYKTFQNKLETLFGKPHSTEIGTVRI